MSNAVRPYPAPSSTQLLAHLRARAASVTDLRGRAKADYMQGHDRVKIAISVVVARPDRLRLAAESAFTGPLLTLATDGTSFQLLDVRQNRFLSGPVSPCNIARLIRVALPPGDVVDVLLGGAALPAAPRSAEVSWDGREGGREVLTLRDETGRREVVRLDARDHTWDLREAEWFDAAGHPLWRVRHQAFAPLGVDAQSQVRLPGETEIEDLQRKSDVRLRWKERQINAGSNAQGNTEGKAESKDNPAVPDSVFHLDPPPGLATEVATCAG